MDSNEKRYCCMYLSCAFPLESHCNLGRHELECRHKKRHCSGKSLKRDETVKGEYYMRSSGLEKGPSDVVWRKDGSSRAVVQMPTII